MAQHRRNQQDDNDSRQQPNRAYNDIAWQRQVNSANGKDCGYGLSAGLRFVNVLWHLCLSRINEICNPINTRAYDTNRVNYVTLALSGPVGNVIFRRCTE